MLKFSTLNTRFRDFFLHFQAFLWLVGLTKSDCVSKNIDEKPFQNNIFDGDVISMSQQRNNSHVKICRKFKTLPKIGIASFIEIFNLP